MRHAKPLASRTAFASGTLKLRSSQPIELNGLVDGACRSKESLSKRRSPRAGAIGKAFDLPTVVSFESVMSSTERANIVRRGFTSGFPTFGMVKIREEC